MERAIFNKYDVDGSGYLDREEFIAFIKEMTEHNVEPEQHVIDAIISQIDTNNDVRIDYEEFKHYTDSL